MAKKKDINILFAERLRSLRAQQGLTQQNLAELAGIDYKHIQRLESQNPSSPTLETIEKVATAFKINCSKLLDFED